MSLVIDRRTFTIDEYHRMAESGILTKEDRVELINGEIIAMSPINSPHASAVDRISNILKEELGKRIVVRVQSPLEIPNHSEPEPDIMLLKPRSDYYAEQHPTPEDVYLLVEVADSSLVLDRELKLPLYAQAGVPEVWIVNLADQQIEVHRSLASENYRETQVARRSQTVVVPFFALEVAVKDLIG